MDDDVWVMVLAFALAVVTVILVYLAGKQQQAASIEIDAALRANDRLKIRLAERETEAIVAHVHRDEWRHRVEVLTWVIDALRTQTPSLREVNVYQTRAAQERAAVAWSMAQWALSGGELPLDVARAAYAELGVKFEQLYAQASMAALAKKRVVREEEVEVAKEALERTQADTEAR